MDTTISSLRAEFRSDSTDVATPIPRLSWTVESSRADWVQARAEIELDGSRVATIDGSESVFVAWPFAPITPRSEHRVRVRVTGTGGDVSNWSERRTITAAFLEPGEWTAAMIGLPTPARVAQPVMLRFEFVATSYVMRATLYATAHGAYQAWVNGVEVDDQVLKPGWTPYPRRLVHDTSDVTALVTKGVNALGLQLAGAWYTERYGFRATSLPFYGEQPATAAQLVLDYEDGSRETIVTGPEWRAFGDGPVVDSGLFDGETYDARREVTGWAVVGFDDSTWSPARVDDTPIPVPVARAAPVVRPIEELPAQAVLTSASGNRILDFGQNLVGRMRIRVSGVAGTALTLRYAEVLEHGELGVRPLRLAKATDTYILKGRGEEIWEPRFTYHGFRYAELTGLPRPIEPASATAVVIHSDMRRTGWFESSHPLLNKLHENIVWGMRGNFFYLPTDCPQRDERLGWTGDIQAFAPTASFLYDTDGFLASWLADLAVEQSAAGQGIVPFVVPSVLHDAATPAAAWGDAATVVPSVLFERFGDRGTLAAQYDSMHDWSECLIALAGERLLWEGGFQFGDWLDPTAPPNDAFQAKTDLDLVATSQLFRSVSLTAEAAATLGKADDARRFHELAERIREAFLREYVTEAGRVLSDSQTAYALAITLGLFRSDDERSRMADRLAELLRNNGYRIGTGFVGTPIIADALTDTGHLDAVGRLLTQTENPSWLYPVTMGATTIWERWDSMLEDGTINPGEMTSFNHYALGGVGDWMHRTLAGLAPSQAGYRVIRIAPRPLAELDHAAAEHITPYGRARVSWRRSGLRIVVEAIVPANSSAEVSLPGATDPFTVGSGHHRWEFDDRPHPAVLGQVSLETSLADIMDDRVVYETIRDVLDEHEPDVAHQLRRNVRWTSGVPLGQVLGGLSSEARDAVLTAISDLNSRAR